MRSIIQVPVDGFHHNCIPLRRELGISGLPRPGRLLPVIVKALQPINIEHVPGFCTESETGVFECNLGIRYINIDRSRKIIDPVSNHMKDTDIWWCRVDGVTYHTVYSAEPEPVSTSLDNSIGQFNVRRSNGLKNMAVVMHDAAICAEPDMAIAILINTIHMIVRKSPRRGYTAPTVTLRIMNPLPSCDPHPSLTIFEDGFRTRY